ncbi:MAG: DUF481 domain-containing protein [Planctomycetota bacterium]
MLKLQPGLFAALVVVCVMAASAPAVAQDAPAPDSASFDKLQHGSGAHADAEFKGYEKGKLEFASGFGDLKVAPGDLASVELKAERKMYAKRSKKDAAREITVFSADGKLRYREAGESGDGNAFNWDDFFMLKSDPIPSEKWSGSIAATLGMARGNTEDVSAGVMATLKRATLSDELTFTYEFGYTETGGTGAVAVSRRFHEGTATYRNFLTDTFNVFIKDTIRHDVIGGVDIRNVIDVGASLMALREVDDSMFLRFDLSSNFTLSEDVGASLTNYLGATFTVDFKATLLDALILLATSSLTLDFDTIDNWSSTSKLTLKNDLGEGFTLAIVAQYDYDNQPAAGFRASDFRLTAILGWAF